MPKGMNLSDRLSRFAQPQKKSILVQITITTEKKKDRDKERKIEERGGY